MTGICLDKRKKESYNTKNVAVNIETGLRQRCLDVLLSDEHLLNCGNGKV